MQLLFQSVDNRTTIDVIKETQIYHQLLCLFFQFCISSVALVLHFLLRFVSYYMILPSFSCVALNSLLCADVPLRNWSLTHNSAPSSEWWLSTGLIKQKYETIVTYDVFELAVWWKYMPSLRWFYNSHV